MVRVRYYRPYQRKFSRRKKIFRSILRLIFYGLILLILLGLAVFVYFAKDLPDPSKISQRQVIQSTKIYDRTGQEVLYDIHAEEKRTVIPIEQIPVYIKAATIVIEDDNFYHHFGLDWRGILRAAWANLRGQRIAQGGSTITQQFIKNAILTSERTLTRKIKEAILSLELERRYSKDEILGFYLNQIPYGSNAYGIEAAAQTFFEQSTQDLSLAEAALLAALPKAPTYYSPCGSHLEELKARQEYILGRMVKFGYLTEEEAEGAKNQELKYSACQRRGLKAPHFVMYIQEYLEEKYGQDYVERAGLRVYTTLDWNLQQIAEAVIAEYAPLNEKKYLASNAALVALDPKTGQILAMVGSRDYFDIENQGNFNVAVSPHRQPGSSFKPFAYAVALEKGYPPETILFDLETNFGEFGAPGQEEEYKPQNYDGKFRGPVTLKQALAQSINLPSVKVLYLAGVNQTIDLAQDMGITTLKDRSRYSLSLVLGGGEVKLIDETAAYGVLATEGIKHPLSSILKIEDAQGNILEEYQDEPVRVLAQEIARQINGILSDEEARAPMFGSHSKLYLPDRPAAAKTGTTQEYRDGWTIGYTPSLVAGVWAGNNDYTKKMKNGAGIYVAAPIWNEFMTRAYELKTETEKGTVPSNDSRSRGLSPFELPEQIEEFTPPEPTPTSTKPMLDSQFIWQKKVKIDTISEKLATHLTPPELIEERTYAQSPHCLLYYVDKDDPLGLQPEEPETDPQFFHWEEPVLAWASSTHFVFEQPPTEYDDVHIPANQPEIKITSPQDRGKISQDKIVIQAEASAPLGIKQLDFFFQDELIGSDFSKPYLINLTLPGHLSSTSTYSIKVRAYDTVLNRQEDEIEIIIP